MTTFECSEINDLECCITGPIVYTIMSAKNNVSARKLKDVDNLLEPVEDSKDIPL